MQHRKWLKTEHNARGEVIKEGKWSKNGQRVKLDPIEWSMDCCGYVYRNKLHKIPEKIVPEENK